MRGIKAFKDQSDSLLSEICALHFYKKADSVIFQQGGVRTAWYIILSGGCKVLISKTGRISDSIHVATMHEGSGFGDLALVNDKPLTATISTATAVQLISVEKAITTELSKYFTCQSKRRNCVLSSCMPFS